MTTRWLVPALALIAPAALADNIVWNEAVDGDLSNDIAAPTDFGTLAVGLNTVVAEFGFPSELATEFDFDVFTFTIAAGQTLTAIFLDDYVEGDALSFFAIDDGSVFPIDPNAGDPSAFLGGVLFGTATTPNGSDLLALAAIPQAGGTGFSLPLGPGTYSVYIQQTGPLTGATLSFQVVPGPSSLAALGAFGLLASRRRRG